MEYTLECISFHPNSWKIFHLNISYNYSHQAERFCVKALKVHAQDIMVAKARTLTLLIPDEFTHSPSTMNHQDLQSASVSTTTHFAIMFPASPSPTPGLALPLRLVFLQALRKLWALSPLLTRHHKPPNTFSQLRTIVSSLFKTTTYLPLPRLRTL